eukprot:11222899-Lingulodinium_polyedra.AAC.1
MGIRMQAHYGNANVMTTSRRSDLLHWVPNGRFAIFILSSAYSSLYMWTTLSCRVSAAIWLRVGGYCAGVFL